MECEKKASFFGFFLFFFRKTKKKGKKPKKKGKTKGEAKKRKRKKALFLFFWDNKGKVSGEKTCAFCTFHVNPVLTQKLSNCEFFLFFFFSFCVFFRH